MSRPSSVKQTPSGIGPGSSGQTHGRTFVSADRPAARQTRSTRTPNTQSDGVFGSRNDNSNSKVPMIGQLPDSLGVDKSVRFNVRPQPRGTSGRKRDSETPRLLVPQGPELGLERQTTMMTVYSNLQSHNRPEYGRGEPTVVTSGPEMKLIQAANKGDLTAVSNILNTYPDMKLTFVDKSRRTVLHHCLDAKSISSDLLLSLLKRNPPTDIIDQSDQIALHNAVRLGNATCVYLLLKHGASVNLQNKTTSRTALHEAAIRGHVTITQILLCYGASSSIKDKDGKIPAELCKGSLTSGQFQDIIEEVSEKRFCVKELTSRSFTQFGQLGIEMRANGELLQRSPILCKRQMIERVPDVTLNPGDDIISDVYTCHLLDETDSAAPYSIAIRIYNVIITSREDVLVRLGDGRVISDVTLNNDQQGQILTFDTSISRKETFTALLKPKIELWEVGTSVIEVTSSLDKRVKLRVPRNVFIKRSSSLALEILEMPEEADIIEGQIIAATPVYKLSADDTAIASLQIEIPMPASFGADSELVVLQHVGDTWSRVSGIHDDSNPMSVICDVSALPVHVMAAQVVPGTGDAALFKEATAALSQTLHTHCNVGFLCFSKCVERTARFTVVLECCPQKTLDARRQAWTLQGFKEQSRENMAESRPEAFSIKSLEEFHILFCDKNNLLRADLHRRVLSFHRKRLNVLTFEIDLKGRTVQFMNCRLVVSKRVDTDNAKQGDKQRLTYFDVNLVVNPVDAGWSKSTETVRMSQNPRNTSSARSVRGLEQSQMRNVKTARQRDLSSKSMADAGTSGSVVGIERSPKPMEARALNVKPAMDGLARLQATVERALNNVDPVPDIEIVVTPPEEQEAPEEKSRDPDMKYLSNNSNAVLLDDALLDDLVEAFGASWYKAFVLMGLPFMEIDTALLTSKNVNVTKRQMFRTWRNVNQSRDDLGVPLLMGALFKGGFRNVAARLQTAVKSWFEENKSSEVPFKYWVIEAYKNSDLLVPPDYPKPMSDPNLVLMSDELPLSRNLARALAIPDDVAEDIINSKHLLIDEIRVMKMLTCFRDRQARSIDALEALLEALLSLRCESMYKYAIMCAKAWVKRTATRKDDPFRSQVDTLMQKC